MIFNPIDCNEVFVISLTYFMRLQCANYKPQSPKEVAEHKQCDRSFNGFQNLDGVNNLNNEGVVLGLADLVLVLVPSIQVV